ncbi:MAG: HD domain-containing protein [bacterium]|nr:HD domain-containing protein [bacterium]
MNISKINEQNLKYNNVSATPSFGKLKFKKPKNALNLAKAGVSSAVLAATLPLTKENTPTAQPKEQKKQTVGKFIMSNFFNMNLYTKEVTVSTLKKIPQENKQIALQALNNIQEKYKNKEIDEYYRIDTIGKVLPLLNEKNLPMFNEIMKADIDYMKEKNIRRIAFYYVEPLLNNSEEDNIEKFKITSQLKNKDNEYIFNDYCILDIVKNKDIKSQNLKTIAQSERIKKLNSYDIMAIASRTNEENNDVLPDLLEYKNIHNNYNFDYYDITAILDITKKENCQHIKNYLNNPDYTWLTGHLYSHYFRNIFASLNSNNTEILPIVMDEHKKAVKQERNIITSDADITHLLNNITNDETKILKYCLDYKDGRSDEYYYERHSINSLPELVHSLSDEKLAPITKNLLEQKVEGYNTFLRFSNIDGIKNLSQIIYENDKNKMDSLNYVLSLKENSEPRFSMIKNIVALTNLLSDEDKKQKTQEILNIKVPEGYRFDDFYNEKLTDKITKDLDIEKVKKLASIKETRVYGYSLTLNHVLDLIDLHNDWEAEQFPIPEVLPPNVNIDKVLNNIQDYKNNKLDFNSLGVSDKIMLDRYVSALQNSPDKNKFIIDVESLKRDLTKAISQTIVPTQTEQKDKVDLFKKVLSNKTDTENTIKNYDFAKYKRNGIPLKYSRNEFLKDLKSILDTVDEDKAKSIISKLQIELNPDKTGYDGIINFCELDKNDEVDKKVYDLCEKFILKNEVKTDDENFDETINALIKGLPEFVNIIGKQPHGSHDFSIDIHILEVLKNCLNHPDYNNLSDIDKTRLKFAVLLHDIAKKEGVVDKNHQNTSALYARNILSKYNIPQAIKDDIYLIIKNHHWLEAVNTNSTTKEALSCNFKNPNDFKLSKIFAYSDLKAVSKNIFDMFSPVLESDAVKELEEIIETNKETGNAIFTTKVVFKDRIPTQTLNNQTYKVFDFKTYPDDKDLSEVGFVNGTKKADLRFLMHMVRDAENLNTVETLSDVANNSVLSETFVSLDKAATYYGDGMGVILDSEIPNIVNAYYQNQGSGYGKDQETVVELRTRGWKKSYRDFIPTEIQNILNITPQEYAKLFDFVAKKRYLAQITDDEIINLGEGKEFTGKEIKKALLEAQDTILRAGGSHNEVVAINSKVVGLAAKKDNLEDISPEYLNFAQHYNLPVYLLGNS